jgi:hypothetical protein
MPSRGVQLVRKCELSEKIPGEKKELKQFFG